MKPLLVFIISFVVIIQVSAQVPSCCVQPGACQSTIDPLWANDIRNNALNLSYTLSHTDGYLYLPNEMGDSAYILHTILQQSISPMIWLKIYPNLQFTVRVPLRHINNDGDNVYGLGDASLGLIYNATRPLKLPEQHDLRFQLNCNVPSGHSQDLDTALMYKSLTQTGNGNWNGDIALRYQYTSNKHAVHATISARHGFYQIHNYTNAPLCIIQAGYSFAQAFSEKKSLTYQINVQSEQYFKDKVNNEIAYNSGYKMISLIPRIRFSYDKIQLIAQYNLPVYRDYDGHQLRLNYTFTTGISYAF